jgi:ABC-2 type transport system permease protein
MEFNWYGAYSLYKRETKRFISTINQTILGPAISAATMFFVLTIAAKKQELPIRFTEFVVCGLIAQHVIQASFSNTSASLITSKVIGYIHDIVLPPLGTGEILLAYLAAALTRSLAIGCTLALLFSPFVSLGCEHPFLLIYFACASSVVLANLGMITGIIAKDFEKAAAMNLYLIAPLSLLSCTFYSAKELPQVLQPFAYYNPFFYMIDGFRYGFTGYKENSLLVSTISLGVLSATLSAISAALLQSGRGIKS